MVRTCVVDVCKKVYYPDCGLSFHSFPKNESLKEKWISALKASSSRTMTKNTVICSRHFKSEDYVADLSRPVLKDNAVPSVCLLTERDDKEHTKPKIGIYQRMLMAGEKSLSKLDQEDESGDPGADCIDYIMKYRTFQGDAQQRTDSKIRKTEKHVDHGYAHPVPALKDSAKSSNHRSDPERESFTPINDDGDHEDITNDDDDYQGIEHVKVSENPKLFSWQQNEGVPVPADDEDILDDNNDQDRFYDDGVRKVTSEETGTEQTVPKNNVFRAYQCNNCKGFINGFLYKCVECFDYDLCSTCETKGVHPLHYVLRIPQSRHHDEIQLAIEIIQRELSLSFSKRRADDDTDSVKLEIKEEPDPIYTEEVCVGDISLSKEIDRGSLNPTKGYKNTMESGEDGEPDPIYTEEVCVGDISLSKEIDGGSLEPTKGHKNTMESGESITEHVDNDMVVEMLEDDNDMIVEALEDNEEISSVPLFSENNDDSEDSDEDTQRTTPPLTRSTNKTRRTVTTDRSPDHSENSHEFSDDDSNDDDDFHLPKRKRTTLCTSPKIRTLVRPVEASPQLREKDTPTQASGEKKQVYIMVMPLSKGMPPKYKLKR